MEEILEIRKECETPLELLKSEAFSRYVEIYKSEFIKELSSITNINRENLEPLVNNLIKTNNTNFKGVGQPLRIALTGSKFGPGLYDIIMALGKEEVLKRLSKIIP